MPEELLVQLDKFEHLHACTVGCWREVYNVQKGRGRDAHGFKGDGWGINVEGGVAEYAVAKGLNLFWSGVVGTPLQLRGDVGQLQVRSTALKTGRLILHPKDHDEDTFVFVIGQDCEFRIQGWILAEDAKQSRWWSDPSGKDRPAFFVPRDELRDIRELTQMLRPVGSTA